MDASHGHDSHRDHSHRGDPSDRIVTPGSEISPDTHVGSAAPPAPDVTVAPSTARPGALVEGNRVATARDLEPPAPAD